MIKMEVMGLISIPTGNRNGMERINEYKKKEHIHQEAACDVFFLFIQELVDSNLGGVNKTL